MSYFVKDNRDQDREGPEGNLLDGFDQNRLFCSLLKHEYGKARENTSVSIKLTGRDRVLESWSDAVAAKPPSVLHHSNTASLA
jgi:hypothetical protein